MASVSSLGIGSGIDLNSVVSQLMAVERQPLDNLTQKKSDLTNQISAYGQVKSALSAFQSAASTLKLSSAFDMFTSASSDSDVATATASASSAAGSYDVTVTRLAQAKVDASANFAASTSTVSNAGSLTFTNGDGSTFSINVAAGATLENIRDAINNQTITKDGKTVTQDIATASIVNSGTSSNPQYNLVINSAGRGTDGAVTISSSNGALQSELNFTQRQAPVDAQLTVNGMTVTRSSNTVDDLVPGATLTLTKVGTATITVGRDADGIAAKVSTFVDAYNKLQSTITNLNKKGGTLEADNTVRSVLSNLQGVFNSAPAEGTSGFSDYRYLAQIGVSFQKDGTLALDKDALKKAISTNFDNVVKMFTDTDNGYAQRLYDKATDMVTTGGLLESRTTGMNSQIKSLNDRMDQVQAKLDSTEARLKKQYAAMDTTVASLKNISSYISSI